MRHLQGPLLYPKCFCNNPLSQLIDIPPLDVVFSPSPESNRSCFSSFLLLDSSRLRHTGTHVETPHTSTRTLHQALVPFSHYQGFVPQFCSHFTLYQYGIPLDSIARSLPRRLELNFLYVYRHSLFQNQLAPFLFWPACGYFLRPLLGALQPFLPIPSTTTSLKTSRSCRPWPRT